MYRNFNNIKITKDCIEVYLLNGKSFCIHPKFEINWKLSESQNGYGFNGECISLHGKWLILRQRGEEDMKIWCNEEVRYLIDKSLRGSGEFDLNYRKHLRSKYSKEAMDICYLDYVDQEMSHNDEDSAFLVESLKEIRKQAEEFSFGVESKPIVIIGPSWDTDTFQISYMIIKDGNIVKRGRY